MAQSTSAAESDYRVNLAAQSRLPTGKGLASSYPGDHGLRENRQVIFADDFESGNLGDGWDETSNKGGKVLQYAVPDGGSGLGKHCLRVEAHLGQDTGGGLTKWFEPAETVERHQLAKERAAQSERPDSRKLCH